MDKQLAIACIEPAALTCSPYAEIPADLIDPANQRLMVNDGCVLPNNDVLVGVKDFKFGTDGLKIGKLLRFRNGRWDVLRDNEVCPNGNAAIEINGRTHLLHIETSSQTVWALPYNLDTGEFDAKNWHELFSFKVPSNFPADIYHEATMPDGCCQWKTSAGRDKAILAIFDYRKESRVGRALQYDITNGEFTLEVVYELPGSPRVTHPAVVIVGKEVAVFFTTASEGLFEARGTDPEIEPAVGAIFRATGRFTGLNADEVLLPTPFRL
jgi:hypothetical protein